MKLIIKKYALVLLIILSALMLGFSRYPQNLDFLAFLAFIPMFLFFKESIIRFEQLKVSRKIINYSFFAFVYTIIFLPVCVHWISLVTLGGFIGILFLYSFYYAILFNIIGFCIAKKPRLIGQMVILGFISLEYALAFGPFKFPWMNIGYSLAHSLYLLQLLEYGGVYLLSFLILLINYLLFKTFFDKETNCRFSPKQNFLFALIILLLSIGIGYYRYHNIKLVKKDVKIGIVQVSIPQELKWNPEFVDHTFNKYESSSLRLAQRDSVDLIIWPESATPVYLIAWDEFRDRITNFTQALNTKLFTGFPHYIDGIKYPQQPEPYLFYNSATQFNIDRSYDSLYYKHHLVPFGERIPFLEYFPVLWKLQLGQANFEAGSKHQYYVVKNTYYSPLICFEILFPDYIREMLKQKTDFIVNITNDAWYKRSIGTYQHKMITVYRAIECRRAIYRSANTGYTVIISPRGDILKQINLYEEDIISEPLSTCEYKTFYLKIGYIIPLIILFSFLLEIILTIFIKNDKRNLL